MQLPPIDAQGRRLGQVLVARWKLMNAAPAFCEAFTQQPPNTLDRAQACLAYMQVRTPCYKKLADAAYRCGVL
jgi:hypothetical protein